MPVYTYEKAITLILSHGPGPVMSYTFEPKAAFPDGSPRVTSPATAEPPEILPAEILQNLKIIKEWMAEATGLNNYKPTKIREDFYQSEMVLTEDGAVRLEMTIGVRDPADPGEVKADPPALVYKREWDPADNLVSTDPRPEFSISYPAFAQFIEDQRRFIELINHLSEGA